MSRIVVLNFHGIGEPHAGVPADEVPYWLSEARFREIVGLVVDKGISGRVAFTFDDGNASDMLAARILGEHGLAGRFFVLTGRLGQDHYLAPSDLRALAASGMTVGLHGRDHVNWRRIGPAQFEQETSVARANLADALGQPVDEVAIPFGAYNRSVISRLQSQAFARIHTSDQGTTRAGAPIWQRNTLRSDMDMRRIGAILHDDCKFAVRARRVVTRELKRRLV